MKCPPWIACALVSTALLSAQPAVSEVDSAQQQQAALSQVQTALEARDRDAAMAALKRAVAAGFSGLGQLIKTPEFTELRIAPGMNALLAQSAANRPRPVVTRTQDAAELPLTSGGLIWDAATSRFEVTANLEAARSLPLLDPAKDGDFRASELAHLQKLYDAEQACGLGGVLYDNRDRGHSRFPHEVFPQLTRTTYDTPLRDRSLDYGADNRLRFSVPTFGNSSTMYRGLRGRALPRWSMTNPGQAAQAFANYASNHVYVFPGDSDPFPANWPYNFATSGMSGSDQWVLRAVALILAALPCDTRDFAEARGLIAPTVQMVFRRAQAGVATQEDYLGGAAHPMIFRDSATNPRAMMDLAASLRPQDLPPMVRLEVTQDSFVTSAGLLGRTEVLFDTPSAIGRVWRGFEGRHELVVSAAKTEDPNGRALEWDWVLLRGDPALVKITPLDGGRAEITIDWHDKIPLNPELSMRVDVGVFASNGAHLSAPGFISVHFPAHQKRRHVRGPGGVPRLVSIDYDTTRRFDPILFWRAAWQDVFGYNPDGSLAGWVRTDGTRREQYRASGARADGRLSAYKLEQSGEELPVLRQVEKK